MTKLYVIPVLLTNPAESYEEANSVAESTADNLATDAGIGVGVVSEFEYDNAGQRVLYLHPEDKPGEPEEEVEEEYPDIPE